LANGHGGHREGAGRPTSRVLNRAVVEAVETQLRDVVPLRLTPKLVELAEGGRIVRKRKWQPAGTVFVDATEQDPNTLKWARTRTLAFPLLPADQLVCVEMTEEELPPDLRAIIYAHDRLMGRTGQGPGDSVEDGPTSLRDALERSREIMLADDPEADPYDEHSGDDLLRGDGELAAPALAPDPPADDFDE
jgi:hypothetical protein